mgnify:CR=1 FL=1
MKKVLIHIGLIFTFIITYFLQAIFFSEFTIAGIMPNIFVILMLYIGLYMGRTMGITYRNYIWNIYRSLDWKNIRNNIYSTSFSWID